MTGGGPMGSHTRKSNMNSMPSLEKPQRTKIHVLKNEHIPETHSAGNNNGLPHERLLDSNFHSNGFYEYPTETYWPERRYVEDSVKLDFWNYEERNQGEVSPNAVIDKHMRDQYNGGRWERQSVENTDNRIKTVSKTKMTENNVVLRSDSAKSNAAESEPKRVVPLKPERSKKLKGKYGAKDQSEKDTIYSDLFDDTKGKKSEESPGFEKTAAFFPQTTLSSVTDNTRAASKRDYTSNGYVRENQKSSHASQPYRKQFQDTEDNTYQRLSADDDQACFEDTSPLSAFPSNLTFLGFEPMTALYSHIKSQKSREIRQKQSSPTDSGHSLLKSSSLESAKKKPSVTIAWHLLVSHRNYRHRMNLHILML